jgi:MoaA/NifB/PqqE/SkfB family radical SAM enzyme
MSLNLFGRIIDALPGKGMSINLQGEGEPLLHPQFGDIVRITTEKGHQPYVITNGTRLPPKLINKYFPSIGISIDTIDHPLAEKIGRLNLSKVLRNINTLIESGYPAKRIIVHTVSFGQNLEMLREYVTNLGVIHHIVQPLQIKDDYRYRYERVIKFERPALKYRCRYLDENSMLFFNIDGVDMPCCFIKKVDQYESREHIEETLAKGVVPECCAGCRELH